MDGNTTFKWSSIIDKEYNSIDHLIDTLIDADCRHFQHYDELVKDFKSKVDIRYGDFELGVYCLDRVKNNDITFEHFIANSLNRYKKETFTLKERDLRKDDEPNSFPSKTPIGILYDICDFGALHWKSKHLSNYYTYIHPTTTINDLYDIEYKSLWKIYKNNQDNQDIESNIINEFSLLKEICTKYETFGDAILPTPYDDILEMVVRHNNGNDKMVYFSTATRFYYMILQTS